MAAAMALGGTATPPVGAQELAPGGTFVDDDGNTHEGFIEAVAAADITAGCTTTGAFFCPSDAVTRAQMATFLARALDLETAGHPDAFDDDDGSTHEGAINAVAAAGITEGCADASARLFCPDLAVNRAQMATFLVRALPNLTPGPGDSFGDDDGSVHEPNIEGLVAGGVTLGCDAARPDLYCPGDDVRRDQMATFLGRALGLTPLVPPARTGFLCTEVIGFSQTQEWYEPNGGTFESTVDDDAWQLRWRSSSYIQLIGESDWPAWAERPKSECAVGVVDRVVLTISGLYGSNVDSWEAGIADAVDQVRVQHTQVREILLQPVVGGPAEALCFFNGQQIRASFQHPYIDQAIARVAAADPAVRVGFSPEVPTCDAYRDSIGHLDEAYRGVIGGEIGAAYLGA
jgi:hypothetical protein